MNSLRGALPAILLAVAVGTSASAQTASTETPAATAPTAGQPWHGAKGRHHGALHHLLGQLNLTADQKTQVKSIFAQAKPQIQALRTSGTANRASLVGTPPTDPGYAALIATAKTNAAARVQLKSDIWTQVYAVLTPAQQAQIPGIVAADKAKWDAKKAAWKSEHAQG